MSDFTAPEDICNRGMQHIGIPRITSLGIGGATQDDTKQAAECAFAYDKLRLSEMARNTWRFAIRKAMLYPVGNTSAVFTPSNWSNATTYAQGQLVSYNGLIWQSNVSGNLDIIPSDETTQWGHFFGQLTILPYNPSTVPATSYLSGDIVYTPGPYNTYASGTTYAAGAIVLSSSVLYISLVGSNTGNTPASSPSDWAVVSVWSGSGTYTTGQAVQYNGIVYTYLNPTPTQNIEPDQAPWVWQIQFPPNNTVYMSLIGSNTYAPPGGTWLLLSGTLTQLQILYPLGSGPSQQTDTLNVFPLPNGYLREAPQAPKQGSDPWLGFQPGRMYTDWLLEGNFLTTRESNPFVFRFVADVSQVAAMDNMFCEGLGARIGYELAETLTQAADKKQAAGAAYTKFMTEARLVNGIEEGPTEPPEDDYITARI